MPLWKWKVSWGLRDRAISATTTDNPILMASVPINYDRDPGCA
ncbi:MAG TPA: hypothetical protein V6C57_07920 [Coleofasciculaceae cyanobacterium]